MQNSERARCERRDLALLTGSRAGEMLRLAVAEQGILRSWAVHQVHHRPGAGVSIGYTVVFDTNRHQQRVDTYLVASTERIAEDSILGVQGKILRFGSTRVCVWQHPCDPELPALELACTPHLLSDFLGERVEIELLGYRPTRRAVVRIERESGSALFGKVVRSKDQPDLERRLELVNKAGVPAPVIYKSAPGFVVTTPVAGVALSRYFSSITISDAIKQQQVLNSLESCLDSLPYLALGMPQRAAWVDRCEHYAHAAALALPEYEERCHNVAKRIRELLKQADLGPVVPTHGDFYEANIYVDPQTGKLTGLLDLDSLSPGHRVHDWACLLAHMSVLPSLAPQSYRSIPVILDQWFDSLATRVDPVALCASAAGVVISLVAGARKQRKQWNTEAENRLRIAENWIERGQSLLEEGY
ncbi:aminoglycoside phosphotransferase (APT) family kinase protein [Arcanobacterium pluranimalium]|uniref:phosphotransferase n=1 Tax=Arcanobacterium pluranimalium TaxID=108028 RepID=UPI00195A911F|nr:phosphotransferase [Arcanobacterium pluranimalium]MBM7824906.1 aminoglycoside phosphotransferase (APT) family kinase protein [Arcanobacterium pluranimalium]